MRFEILNLGGLIIEEGEKEIILNKYGLDKYTQLPLIVKDDPVAKFE